jgi:hypothetical protein
MTQPKRRRDWLKNWNRYCRPMLPKWTMLIWGAVLVASAVVIALILALAGSDWRGQHMHEVLIAFAGAVLAAIFQISAAYHARVSHFLECSSRCNATYAKLNGLLKEPSRKSRPTGPRVNDEPSDPVIDYFNLCAEEHLMHKMGVIPDFVWDVWCAGIHDMALEEHVRKAWDKEKQAKNDYYGFDLEQTVLWHHKAHGLACGNCEQCPLRPMIERAILVAA